MALDKVGHFVLGVVVKAKLDRDAYLACMGGTDQLAVLPKSCADGPYRVQDRFYASIKSVGEQYPILSQRSGHFLRHVCELVFRPLIAERRVVIDAVATVQQAGFVKIAVSNPTGEDPIKLCMPYLPEFRTYCRLHPSLVRYSHMVEQYIKQALVPAPVTAIESVELCRASREAIIRVPASVLGRFVGIKGMNVAVASRLTGHGIRVVPAEQVMPPCLL